MPRTFPHPHKQDEKAAFAKEQKRLRKIDTFEEVDDIKFQMSTVEGRREAYRLLRQGMRLPGQTVSNTNGSLQSYQLGRSDCMRDFDDRIRAHCNNEWITMLEENGHNQDEQ